MIHTKKKKKKEKSTSLPSALTISFLLLQHETKDTRYASRDPIKLLKRITLFYSTFQLSLVNMRIINYSNALDLSI